MLHFSKSILRFLIFWNSFRTLDFFLYEQMLQMQHLQHLLIRKKIQSPKGISKNQKSKISKSRWKKETFTMRRGMLSAAQICNMSCLYWLSVENRVFQIWHNYPKSMDFQNRGWAHYAFVMMSRPPPAEKTVITLSSSLFTTPKNCSQYNL